MILIKQMYIFPDSSEMEKHVAIVYLAEKKKKKRVPHWNTGVILGKPPNFLYH